MKGVRLEAAKRTPTLLRREQQFVWHSLRLVLSLSHAVSVSVCWLCRFLSGRLPVLSTSSSSCSLTRALASSWASEQGPIALHAAQRREAEKSGLRSGE